MQEFGEYCQQYGEGLITAEEFFMKFVALVDDHPEQEQIMSRIANNELRANLNK